MLSLHLLVELLHLLHKYFLFRLDIHKVLLNQRLRLHKLIPLHRLKWYVVYLQTILLCSSFLTLLHWDSLYHRLLRFIFEHPQELSIT